MCHQSGRRRRARGSETRVASKQTGTGGGAATHFVVLWYKKLDSTSSVDGGEWNPIYLCLNAVGATFQGAACTQQRTTHRRANMILRIASREYDDWGQ